MARNTIQKRVTATVVTGIIVKDGEVCETGFEINRKCSLEAAQSIVRKTEPSFSATRVEHRSTLYVMTVDEFIQHARIVDETER